MKFNLNGKKFKSVENTGNGEVGTQTVFNYFQDGKTVWAEYSGGEIFKGHLLGLINGSELNINYHHINICDEIKCGVCDSTLELNQDGLIEITEKWQWLTGDKSSGESVVLEIGQ